MDDIESQRRAKVASIRAAGIDPYPTKFARTHLSREIAEAFASLDGQPARVAGRLIGAKRLAGKIGFCHVLDEGGRIQVVFAMDALGPEGFELFRRWLDIGDFVGVAGEVTRTRAGEISIMARDLLLLCKSARSLPEKWHGLRDVEVRYRQRYLDLIANHETREIFATRSRIVSELRRFLDGRGFVEVETPVLQAVAGGGAARSFSTRSWALERELFLRIALELYLKRCIIGGIEHVYEIGKNFRNEGMSFKHQPEFTMLELYQAYADYRDIMELTEAVVAHLATSVVGDSQVAFRQEKIEFAPPWRRMRLVDAIRECSGVDYERYGDLNELREASRRAGLKVDPGWSRGKILDELLTAFVEPRLVQPTFLVDYPLDFPGSTLAKARPGRADEVERFEAFAGGMEIANAFSELNDPEEQRARFQRQAAERERGDDEAEPMDNEFLEALEYGMPPTGGLGLGIDRVVMLLTNRQSIREVILFPQMRSFA